MSDPTLPQAVETAMLEARLAAHDTGLFASDKYVEREIKEFVALRAAILSYGAARERQGIERAARFLDTMAAEMKNLEEARVGVSVAAEHLRALPVDGATPKETTP